MKINFIRKTSKYSLILDNQLRTNYWKLDRWSLLRLATLTPNFSETLPCQQRWPTTYYRTDYFRPDLKVLSGMTKIIGKCFSFQNNGLVQSKKKTVFWFGVSIRCFERKHFPLILVRTRNTEYRMADVRLSEQIRDSQLKIFTPPSGKIHFLSTTTTNA